MESLFQSFRRRRSLKEANTALQKTVEEHGDLILDICRSVVGEDEEVYPVFRRILKQIQNSKTIQKFNYYERASILKITYSELQRFSKKKSRENRGDLSVLDPEKKVANFKFFFSKLEVDEQFLLLLKDKFDFSYSEIGAAMGTPEESLKIRRQQAFRSLEEWIWDK